MKKFINYIKASLLLLVATALLTSCKKFLTENPTTQFTAEFVYNTPEGLESGVVALYNFQRTFGRRLIPTMDQTLL